MYTVYWLLDPTTKEIRYVGQTKQLLEVRLAQHCQASKKPTYYVHHWIKTLKVPPIIKAAYTHLSEYEVDILEPREIARLKANGARLCNLASGGGRPKMADTTKKKMSISHQGSRNHFFGKTHTDETKKLIGFKNKTQKWSQERRKKHSEVCSGAKNGFYGKTHTPETKKTNGEKISLANAKQFSLISPEGEVVHVTNLLQFCKLHNLINSNLWLVAVGKRKSHKGWRTFKLSALDPKT